MRNMSFLPIVAALAILAHAETDSLTRKSVLPDSLQKKLEQEIKNELLLRKIDGLSSVKECDTIKSFSEKEKKICKDRYSSLHPEEKWGF